MPNPLLCSPSNPLRYSLVGSPLAEQLDVALVGDLLDVAGKSLNGSHLDASLLGGKNLESAQETGKRFLDESVAGGCVQRPQRGVGAGGDFGDDSDDDGADDSSDGGSGMAPVPSIRAYPTAHPESACNASPARTGPGGCQLEAQLKRAVDRKYTRIQAEQDFCVLYPQARASPTLVSAAYFS